MLAEKAFLPIAEKQAFKNGAALRHSFMFLCNKYTVYIAKLLNVVKFEAFLNLTFRAQIVRIHFYDFV